MPFRESSEEIFKVFNSEMDPRKKITRKKPEAAFRPDTNEKPGKVSPLPEVIVKSEVTEVYVPKNMVGKITDLKKGDEFQLILNSVSQRIQPGTIITIVDEGRKVQPFRAKVLARTVREVIDGQKVDLVLKVVNKKK